MRFSPQNWIALAIAATIVVAAPNPQKNKRAPFPDPNDDDFYKNPANITSYSNGEIIRSRKATTDLGNLNNVDSLQLSYRTTNTQNEAQANVATVWLPAKPASPPKIFSYQLWEDSTQLNCAPSYNYLTGLDQPNKVSATTDTLVIVSWALQQGYYVVSSDHEGPRSAFIGGWENGMAVLDGVRALKHYKSLPSDSAVGFYSYSGGGHATAWAVNLQESYAPELNIVAAAYGGVPTSALLLFLNKGFVAGFVVAGLSGISLAYPEVEAYLKPRLTARGQQALAQVQSRDFCVANVVTHNNFVDVFSLVNQNDFLDQDPVRQVIARETLLQAEASYTVPVPRFPRFMWHGNIDEIVPFISDADYVKEQCRKGANINWNVLPLTGHAGAEIVGLVPALDWMGKVFRGQTPKVSCGNGVPVISGINSPSARQVLGSDLAKRLEELKSPQSSLVKLFSGVAPS
ncbi:probable lipase precursor [Sporisorium reilianum f. sp. reilianum]|uniref:Lipase n=1 Tax=Sporisorium reilianum f. sp. reilianum TaxID=72559 RepID=A0A2N8UHB4_9BASI|nr:probable lipase precursor [Sporisorium reilianum f. sp. reilianum]